MELFRVCPACGHENPASELMCVECMCFIGNVTPAEAREGARETPEATAGTPGSASQAAAAGTVKASRFLTLLDGGGEEVAACEAGAALGRGGVGSAYFQNFPTVSRKHCQIDFGPEGWQISDCGSTNGTWVNGVRISAPVSIREGDIILLSRACSLRVKL